MSDHVSILSAHFCHGIVQIFFITRISGIVEFKLWNLKKL